MVSQWLTTVSRWSAVPRAGPSPDDLVGASDKCHRDRQAKKRERRLAQGPFAAQRVHGLREHSRDHRAYSAHLLPIATEIVVS